MDYNSGIPHAIILTVPRYNTKISFADLEVNYQTVYKNAYLPEILMKNAERDHSHQFSIFNPRIHKTIDDVKYDDLFSYHNLFLYLFYSKLPNFMNFRNNIGDSSLIKMYYSEALDYEAMSLVFNAKRIVENIIQYDCFTKNKHIEIDSIGSLLFPRKRQQSITINYQEKHLEHRLFLHLLNRISNAHKHDLLVSTKSLFVGQNTDRLFGVELVMRNDFIRLLESFFSFDSSFKEAECIANTALNEKKFILLEYNISLNQFMISFYNYIEDLLLSRLREKYPLIS